MKSSSPLHLHCWLKPAAFTKLYGCKKKTKRNIYRQFSNKNMVPSISAGPRCCHFSNILQGGPQNAEKRNLSIRSNFFIIIIICMLIILEMALCQAHFSSGGSETSKLMQSFGDIHVLRQVCISPKPRTVLGSIFLSARL